MILREIYMKVVLLVCLRILIIVAGVSRNAGKKGPVRKRTRSLSPDLVQARTYSVTLGDLSPESSETHSVISRSNSGMKMKIAKPTRPKYTETTTTQFELIKIAGNISKCAGCGSPLKPGPDSLLGVELDEHLCIRHKEKDHVFIPSLGYYKSIFSNRHYHVFKDCVVGRNPSFRSNALCLQIAVTDDLVKMLKDRLM